MEHRLIRAAREAAALAGDPDAVPPKPFSITPSDEHDLPQEVIGIYIGGAGDIALLYAGEEPVMLHVIEEGAYLPVSPRRVLEEGTTATAIVGIPLGWSRTEGARD